MYDQLKISAGYRGEDDLNESMRIALEALDNDQGMETMTFSFNLTLHGGSHENQQLTPIAYLRLVLPTYKYDKNRQAAEELLQRLRDL